MTRATTENRDRAQRRVLALTGGAGVAALAVTGFLTVGLGSSTAATSHTTATATTSSTSSTTGATSTAGSASSSSQQPVATSGGS